MIRARALLDDAGAQAAADLAYQTEAVNLRQENEAMRQEKEIAVRWLQEAIHRRTEHPYFPAYGMEGEVNLLREVLSILLFSQANRE